MSEERATLEIIAPTVEEAVKQGIDQLGVSEDQVEIDILDEGAKGMFGLGGRQARVRLILKDDTAEAASQQSFPGKGVAREEEDLEEESVQPDQVLDADMENTMAIARETVRELLEKMRVNATVSASLGEMEDDEFSAPIIIDIMGDDLSYLIGRRAETLNALQYITRLIVGKEIGKGANVIVDVEGYRARRERNLRQLAERMARQAIKSGRRQSLEPMSPAERRLIHIALRDNDEVYTESVGEGSRRKVTIIPKTDE